MVHHLTLYATTFFEIGVYCFIIIIIALFAFIEGLDLILNVEQYEANLFSESEGLIITIHPPQTTAFPEDNGLSLQAGNHYMLQLGQVCSKTIRQTISTTINGMGGNSTELQYSVKVAFCRMSTLVSVQN